MTYPPEEKDEAQQERGRAWRELLLLVLLIVLLLCACLFVLNAISPL